jgi:hypothetical protein
MQIYPIRGVSQNLVLRNFGVELLRALFLSLVPMLNRVMGYEVDFSRSKPYDRFAVTCVLSQQKIFCFLRVFSHKVGST